MHVSQESMTSLDPLLLTTRAACDLHAGRVLRKRILAKELHLTKRAELTGTSHRTLVTSGSKLHQTNPYLPNSTATRVFH